MSLRPAVRRRALGALAGAGLAGAVAMGLPMTPDAAVGAPAAAWRLSPSSQGYLGTSSQADRHNGVAIQPDGVVAVGGRIGGPVPGVKARALLGGGSGTVVRLARGGSRVLSVTRIGTEVEGLAADGRGNLAVIGSFGVAKLDRAAGRVLWRAPVGAAGGSDDGPGRRVASGVDGTVATLASKRVSVYAADGRRLGGFGLRHGFVNDVAVDSERRLVFVTGFDQADGNLQVAFVSAYDYRGARRWRNYGWSSGDVGGLRSDTRGYRLAVGADGRLYFAGESAGGTSIFHKQPRNIAADAHVVTSDPFNTPYNTGSNHIAFYARLDPGTGAHLAGQWALTRLGPDKGNRGNTILVRALAADERGNVYLGGEAACCLERRKDSMSIAGRRLPDYGGDFYVLVASSRLTSRRTWVAFGGTGEVNAVAAGHGSAAVAGAAYSSGAVLHRAVQERHAGNVSDSAPDGFVSVWANGVGAPTAAAPPKPTKRPTAGSRTPAPATTARSGRGAGAAKLRGDRAAPPRKDKGWLPLGATSRGAAGVAGATAVALLGAGALVLYGVRSHPAGTRARPRSRAGGRRRR